jgi:hypothetical protein
LIKPGGIREVNIAPCLVMSPNQVILTINIDICLSDHYPALGQSADSDERSGWGE